VFSGLSFVASYYSSCLSALEGVMQVLRDRNATSAVQPPGAGNTTTLRVNGIPAQRNRTEVYGGMPILWYSPDAA